ncbi:retropepsin-like aspartic protease [Aureibaculum luteum]
MEKVNGVYQIPCKVNGVEMKFIFDTGASDISISKTEADFLVKQGLLKEEDIIGTQKYRIADGSISVGVKITIREIKINDIFINNVSATVIDNDNAPLLFGQSALSKFGRFEIENDILRIYQKENRNNLEFLGIDLTKTIGDFGLSRFNLVDAKPILGIPFDACKVSKEHELKDFEFEKQSVVFDKEGKIFMVGLTKEPSGKYGYDKEKYAKEFFENLYINLSTKFGTSDTKMLKSAEWKKRNFELLMNIDSDYKVGLFYIPKIFINQDLVMGDDKPEKEYKKNETSSPKNEAEFNEELRESGAELIELVYNKHPAYNNWNLNTNTKGKVLYINMESEIISMRPKSQNKAGRKQIKDIEFVKSKEIAYNIYKSYISSDSKENIEFQASIWDKIVIDFYFSYIDGSNSSLKHSITSQGMLAIGVPLTKKKFDRYFE